MTVSTGTMEAVTTATHVREILRPVQVESGWAEFVGPGGVNAVDDATITNPTADITSSTTTIRKVSGRGTILKLCLAYDPSNDPTQDAIVKVFGRFGDDGHWQLLYNKNGDLTRTLTSGTATDVTDLAFRYTTPDPTQDAWDLDGNNQIIVGLTQDLQGTNEANAKILGKVI